MISVIPKGTVKIKRNTLGTENRIFRLSQKPLTAKLRYECPLCQTNLGPNKDAFQTHIKLHSRKTGNCCKYCFKTFNNLEDLTDHSRNSHRDKLIKCPACSFTSESHSSILLHFDTEKHEKLWEEDMKGVKIIQFENKSYGQDSLFELNQNFECSKCFEELDSLVYFNCHTKIHSGDTVYECKFCFTGFETLEEHDVHLKELHSSGQTRIYSCRFCKFHSKNKNHLIKHAKTLNHYSGNISNI